jgi:hypothetical protein
MKYEWKIFPGTMPVKLHGRQRNCLSPPQADEFCADSEASSCMVGKIF